MTVKSSPLKVISSTLRIVALSSTASRVLGTWAVSYARGRAAHFTAQPAIVRSRATSCQADGKERKGLSRGAAGFQGPGGVPRAGRSGGSPARRRRSGPVRGDVG